MSKKKSVSVRDLRIRWRFDDGDTGSLPIVDAEEQLQSQYHGAAHSEDPDLRATGRRLLKRAAEAAVRGWRHSEEQTAKAKMKRGGVISTIADALANRKDALGDFIPPSELWPEVFASLDAAKLDPVEEPSTKADFKTIHYDGRDGRKTLTMSVWRSTLDRARKKKLP